MVSYTCTTCQKVFERKSTYTDHLSQKYPCEPPNPVGATVTRTEPDADAVKKIHRCVFRDDTYLTGSIMHEHMMTCKMNSEKEATVGFVKENAKDNIVQIVQKNDVINDGQNNGKTNPKGIGRIVKRIPFGKENLNKVTLDTIKAFLRQGRLAIEVFMIELHFSDKYPQYQNIYRSSEHGSGFYAYDGEHWMLIDTTRTLDELYNSCYDFVVDKFNKYKDRMNRADVIKMQQFFDSLVDEASRKKVKHGIKRELKQILYDYRGVVKKNIRHNLFEIYADSSYDVYVPSDEE